MKQRLIAIGLCLSLIACGAEQTASPQPITSTTPESSAEALFTAEVEPGMNYPSSPVSVVQSFLSSVQIDPSGSLSLRYLTPELQQQTANESLGSILQLSTPYDWFTVEENKTAAEHQAQVAAKLYSNNVPQQRIINLRQDPATEVWRIDMIQ